MPAILDKSHIGKDEIAESVAMFNNWYVRFAPDAFKTTRAPIAGEVADAPGACGYLPRLDESFLRAHPST